MVILKQSARDRLPFKCLIGPLSPVFIQGQQQHGLLLTHPQCLGDYLGHPDIIPFCMHPAALKTDHRLEPSNQGLFYGGPAGYKLQPLIEHIASPDQVTVLIWWGFHFALPEDLNQCQLKRFLIVSDWHFHAEALCQYTQQFDAIFCDRQMLTYLNQKGTHSAHYWPAYSFAPELLKQNQQAKQIDICFLGNTNPAYYQQRNLYLRRLSALNQSYHIVIRQNIPHPNYGQLLSASKLIFNHSLRSEMNLRAYEAAACGSLQLIEASNLEVREYLPEACLLYDHQNFEALIHYYLTHDTEREALAQKSQKLIQQHSFTHQLSTLLKHIQEHLEKASEVALINTSQASEADQLILLQITHLLSTDIATLRSRALEMSESLVQTKPDVQSINALAVCRLDYESLVLSQPVSYQAQFTLAEATQRLYAETHKKKDIHSLNNLAWLAFFQSDWRQLEISLTLLEAALFNPSQIHTDILLLPIRYTSLYILRQQAFAKYPADSHELKAHIFKSMQWSLFYLKGNVLLQQATRQSLLQACHCFSQACQIQPEFVESWFELARAYQALQEPLKAIQALQTGLAQGIYYPGAWLVLIQLLQQTGQAPQAQEALRQAQRLFQDPKFKDI